MYNLRNNPNKNISNTNTTTSRIKLDDKKRSLNTTNKIVKKRRLIDSIDSIPPDSESTENSETIHSSSPTTSSRYESSLSDEETSESIVDNMNQGEKDQNEENEESEGNLVEFDVSSIKDALKEHLVKKFGNITDSELDEALRLSMEKVQKNINNGDTMENWKIGLSEEKVTQLQAINDQLIKELKNEKPTILRILEAKITWVEKKRAFRLFQLLSRMDDKTTDYTNLEEYINRLLTSNISDDKVNDLTTNRSNLDNTIPKLDDIIAKQLSVKDKQLALSYYFQSLEYAHNSTEHRDLCTMIRNILESNNVAENEEWIRQEEIKYKALIPNSNLNSLKNRIFNLETNDINKALIYDKYCSLERLTRDDSEYSTIKDQIDWLTSLPWNKTIPTNVSPDNIGSYCSDVYSKLDAALFGMKNVKEELISLIVNRITRGDVKGISLGLVGSGGVGKTEIATQLAKALDLPFEKISINNVNTSSVLTGSDTMYIGSHPSIILQCLRKMKFSNGIILLDEIDKISQTEEGRNIRKSVV